MGIVQGFDIFLLKFLAIFKDELISTENYEYTLVDMSGKIIRGGKGIPGTNTINMNSNPNGIYLIQLISNNQRTTERIVKL